MNEDLRNWFREKWVNIAKKKKSGGYEPCGTSGKKKGYAKCVPAAKAASMSKDEIKSAVRRKRAAQAAAGRPGKDQPGQGNKPIMVKTMKEEMLQYGYTHRQRAERSDPFVYRYRPHCHL